MTISLLKQNILVNLFSRFFGFVITYLFTPLFLKFLGIESIGIIGFFSTLTVILLLTDLGLTASLTRETARLSVLNNSEIELKDILRTYELIYGGISILLALLVWIGSSYIVHNWLIVKDLDSHQLVFAIRIIGIAIAFQLPAGLYFGGLMGLQKQILANSLQITWNLFKGVLTIICLWLISPTILVFAICQLLSNIIYFIVLRRSIWISLPFSNVGIIPKFNIKILKVNLKYSFGIAGISLISVVITQADRLFISKLLPLDSLGYYTLAGTLALLPIMIANPITTAIFPKFTSLMELKEMDNLVSFYHRSCKLTAIAVFPISFIVVAYSESILSAWTGSSLVSKEAALVASILILGQIMQVITTVPFYFVSASGKIKLLLFFQILSAIIFLPTLFFLVPRFGILGASYAWLIMNLLTIPFHMYLFHKKYLPGQFVKWLIHDVFLPIVVILPIITLAKFLMPNPHGFFNVCYTVFLSWLTMSIILILCYIDFRNDLLHYLKIRK